MRALVIEDEKPLREQLERRLRAAGYAVDTAADGEEGLYFGEEFPVDVAVVDIGLPKRSGIEVIRRWREDGRDFPVLILTARGRWQDKVDGLEAGADDYLVKPFHMEELLARLRALVRRSSGFSQNVIQCGPIRLDTGSRRVESGGSAVELTAYEYKVLEYLMLHSGQ
ncbi:MAG TPA: response regulator, partial [Gammaproteobacteria bacterium]